MTDMCLLMIRNHSDNDEERTQNRVEGDNIKIRLFCGAAISNIVKVVKLLQSYKTTTVNSR